MSVVWKPAITKFKTKQAYRELKIRIDNNDTTDKEVIEFVAGLVESWEFIDIETGQPITPGDYGELSEDQYKELAALFVQKIQGISAEAVKKKTITTNESESSYLPAG